MRAHRCTVGVGETKQSRWAEALSSLRRETTLRGAHTFNGDLMRCSQCGSDNQTGKRFCGDCGAPLTNFVQNVACRISPPNASAAIAGPRSGLLALKLSLQLSLEHSEHCDLSGDHGLRYRRRRAQDGHGIVRRYQRIYRADGDLDPEEARAIFDP